MDLTADIDPCRVFARLQNLLLALAIRRVIVSAADLRRGGHIALVVVDLVGGVQLIFRSEFGVGASRVPPGKGVA